MIGYVFIYFLLLPASLGSYCQYILFKWGLYRPQSNCGSLFADYSVIFSGFVDCKDTNFFWNYQILFWSSVG